MSILSDSAIVQNIENGDIVIKPFEPSQLGSNSYDVLLDDTLLVYDDVVLDCKKDHTTTEVKMTEKGFLLQPGTLYLGSIKEYTHTKNHVIMFEGKSSLARLGLFVHITSGFGDVGYNGYLTVELTCVKPLRIYPGQKIGQIYYVTVEGMVINPYSSKSDAKYNNNFPKPIKSMMHKNFETDNQKRFKDSGIAGLPQDED